MTAPRCPGSGGIPEVYVVYRRGTDVRTEPVVPGEYNPRRRAKCPRCWSVRCGRSDGTFPNHAPVAG